MPKRCTSRPAWWKEINWRALRRYLDNQLAEVSAVLAPAAGNPDVWLDDTTIVVILRFDGNQRTLADALIAQALADRNLKSRFRSSEREVADGIYCYDLNISDYEPFRLEQPVQPRRRRMRLSQRHA